MKTLQDWVLQRRFKAIPGVVDVTAFGGKAKEYEIAVDLNRLQAQGLTLVQLVTALNNASINVGGQTLNVGEQSAVVRGIGLIRDMDDIRDTMLSPGQRHAGAGAGRGRGARLERAAARHRRPRRRRPTSSRASC